MNTDQVTVRVMTRTKRAGKYLAAGETITILRAEAEANPSIFCMAEEFKAAEAQRQREAEQPKIDAEQAFRVRKTGQREAFRAQDEARALVADADAKRTAQLAEAARQRLRGAGDAPVAQTDQRQAQGQQHGKGRRD